MSAKKRRGPAKKGRAKPKCRPRTKNPKPPQDPSKPLKNRLREAFAQNLINGEVLTANAKGGFSVSTPVAAECYINAGYKARGHAAESNASRLLKKAEFRARIDHLREVQAEKLADKGVASKEECCQILTDMIRARHSDFLTMGDDGVSMYDVGPETLNQAALKKMKTRIQWDEAGNVIIKRQFDEIELESKIAAVKCLAEIMGFNKSDDDKDRELDIFAQFVDDVTRVPEDQRSPQTG